MAIFRITPTTSVLTTVGVAFDGDTPGADTLIVDPGAFLITTDAVFGGGALLAPTGAWNVIVNGSIFGEAAGIAQDGGNTAVSTIKIGVDGEVGGTVGIGLGSSANVNNAGTINGSFEGFQMFFGDGTHVITNSGEITGTNNAIHVFDFSNNTVRNSGTINGNVLLGDGDDTVTNSHLVNGDVNLGGGINHLTNSGTLDGVVLGGSGPLGFGGTDTVNNTGTITGDISLGLGFGTNKLTNSGEIGDGFVGGIDNDTVINSGTIGDVVFLFAGTNKLINSGTIGNDVTSGSGDDTINNSGTIDGNVLLGDGTNTLTNSGTITGDVLGGNGADTVTDFASGIITGGVFLGDGDDKFTGGVNPETVRDGNGADIVSLGGGDDRYSATGSAGADGIDIVKGGAGIDTYDANSATGNLRINLGAVPHDMAPFNPGAGLVAANTAIDLSGSGTSEDTITGFENANGGFGDDIIYGTAAANVLNGDNGNDVLFGFGGDDTLNGGSRHDILFGGAGKDQLTGGADQDLFLYTALSDSGITTATRDLITDFEHGDTIDLHLVDAITTNAPGTNDIFNFVGTNVQTGFSGSPGELHAIWTATGQIIEGDVNGDKAADFSIEIADPLHAITLGTGDFVL